MGTIEVDGILSRFHLMNFISTQRLKLCKNLWSLRLGWSWAKNSTVISRPFDDVDRVSFARVFPHSKTGIVLDSWVGRDGVSQAKQAKKNARLHHEERTEAISTRSSLTCFLASSTHTTTTAWLSTIIIPPCCLLGYIRPSFTVPVKLKKKIKGVAWQQQQQQQQQLH
jgi:hypothetical protein